MFYLDKFPRELCYNNNRVKIANCKQDVIDFINKYNGIAELHTSVYSFQKTNGTRGDYKTAIIDKIFVDIDCKTKDGSSVNILSELNKIIAFCDQKGYLFSFNWSGRGCHLYFYIKNESLYNPSIAMKNFVNEMLDKTKAIVDLSVAGDLARETRLLNTINTRSGLYCIPLTKEDLKQGLDFIREKAKHPIQLTTQHMYGKQPLSLHSFDSGELATEHLIINTISPVSAFNFGEINKVVVDFNKIKEKVSVFPCMKEIMNDDHAGHEARTALLTKLKQMGLSVYDADFIIYTLLCREKKFKSPDYKHHAADVYRYGYCIPNCEFLHTKGICPLSSPHNCVYFNKLGEIV